MNKKGFTLTELLAVVAIIGILSLVAIPNIIGIIDGIRKDNMKDDAKKLISLAKMEVNSSYEIRQTGYKKFTFDELNKNKDIKKDPDDGTYSNASYVEYKKIDNTETYCIYLEGSKRKIGTSDSCVNENDLYDKDVVSGIE